MDGFIKWVLIRRFCDLTGYSPKAVEMKIEKGVWPQGRIWKNSPDGRRQINLEEYTKWVEDQPLR